LENIVGAREGDDEGELAAFGTVVDCHFFHPTLDGNNVADLGAWLHDSEVTCAVEDDTGDKLGGINGERAVSASWESPSSVEVLLGLVWGGLEVHAGDDLSLTQAEFNRGTTSPAVGTRAIQVVPRVLDALVSLVAIRVGDEEARVDVHAAAVEALLGIGVNQGQQRENRKKCLADGNHFHYI